MHLWLQIEHRIYATSNGCNSYVGGGIGQGAINVLNSAGINVVRGCSGNIETLVNDFIKGSVSDSGDTCGHNHSHGESCGH
jgi:predicted Fe-Mo cluster-binding NifX family protein